MNKLLISLICVLCQPLMASNKVTFDLYEEVPKVKTTSEQLFDRLIVNSNYLQKCENLKTYSRKPVITTQTNDSSLSDDCHESDDHFEPSAKTSKTKANKENNKRINRVKFTEIVDKRSAKKTQNKKKISKKSRDYPDCTKESLLRAFEAAGLPDYEAIARQPLSITNASNIVKPDPLYEIHDVWRDLVDFDRPFDPIHKSVAKRASDTSQENDIFLNSVSIPNISNRSNGRNLRNISNIASIYKSVGELRSRTIDSPINTAGLGASRTASTPVVRKHNLTVKNVSPILTIDSPEVNKPEIIASEDNFVAPLPLKKTKNRRIPKMSSSQELVRLELAKPSRVSSNRLKQISKSFIDTSKSRKPNDSDLSSDESLTIVGNNEIEEQSYEKSSTNTYNTRRNRFLTNKLDDLSSLFDPVIKSTPLVASKPMNFESVVDRNQSISELPIKTTTIVRVSDTKSSLKSGKRTDRKSNAYHLYRQSIASVHSVFNKSCQPFRTIIGDSNLTFSDKTQTKKEKVLMYCKPQKVIDFEIAFDNNILKTCRKIGEGSYGEVFAAKNSAKRDIVIKIVPLLNTNDNEETAFEQILPELVVSMDLDKLKTTSGLNRAQNFIHLIHSTITRGVFPSKLIDGWDSFEKKRGSENEDPRIYKKDQLYIVYYLANGGTDMESYEFKSAVESLSVFVQLALSLAAAEQECEFEHRDLHWGNVLISQTNHKVLNYTVNGVPYNVNPNRVFASLIDFSLSRILSDGNTIFTDLAKDSDLFEGDAEVDYQFEIYRKMREKNQNNWQTFVPKTNIFWLHYILHKAINDKHYSKYRTNAHKNALNLLKNIYEIVLSFESAANLVESERFVQYISYLN